MRRGLFVVCILLCSASPSTYANSYSTEAPSSDYYGYGNNSSDTYTGYSGNQYQYDLSNSQDNMNYQYDNNAQIRDQYNQLKNLNKQFDQGIGQYGGGVYR